LLISSERGICLIFIWSLFYVPEIPESWNLEVEVDLDDREMDVVDIDRDADMYYQNQENPT
jgi:hypothetical protein